MASYKIPILATGLTASKAVATNASKQLISADALTLQTLGITQTIALTSSSVSGVAAITYAGNNFLHTTGAGSLFMGSASGNLTATGTNNTAYGPLNLRAVTSGSSNIAIAREALDKVTTGNNNIALGYTACRDTVGGGNNVAIGVAALRANTSGTQNMAIGTEALRDATGSQNTAIGDNALRLSAGSGSIGIGSRAGAYETGSYKLFLDSIDRTNEANGRTLSLIYGIMAAAAANQVLRINGQVELSAALALNFGYNDVDDSWRFVRSGTNLLVQRRESGSWVTKHTFAA